MTTSNPQNSVNSETAENGESADSRPRRSILGQAVYDRRRDLGLRQVDLADLADVSRRLVETVERGVGSPRLNSVLALFDALGLELVVRPGSSGLRVEIR